MLVKGAPVVLGGDKYVLLQNMVASKQMWLIKDEKWNVQKLNHNSILHALHIYFLCLTFKPFLHGDNWVVSVTLAMDKVHVSHCGPEQYYISDHRDILNSY